MSKNYNIVVSLNFETKKDRDEFEKLFSGAGHTVLYKGVHDGDVYQKVITQKTV